MANPSLIPDPGSKHLHVAQPAVRPAPVKVLTPMPNPNTAGPRKLIRPIVSDAAKRNFQPRGPSPILAHEAAMNTLAHAPESSHAEAFYFQKQIQTQTLMTFVLEDNEVIEGFIEWYDQDVIKVKNGSRILIYKSSIKYLHKSGENRTDGTF